MPILDWLPVIGTLRLRDRIADLRSAVSSLKKHDKDLAAKVKALKRRADCQENLLHQLLRLRTTGTPEGTAIGPAETIQLSCATGEFAAIKVSIDGMCLYVPARDKVDGKDALYERVVNRRRWPIDTLGSLLPFAHGEIMLDIGANIGTTALPRALFGVFRQIHAFEPEPRNFACLVKSIEANRLERVVTAWPYALGAELGEALLTLRGGIGRHRIGSAGKASIARASVPMLTLDEWISRQALDIDAISFVKVDTQGFEPFILAGAKGLLEKRKAIWQLEIAPAYMRSIGANIDDLCSLLQSYLTHFLDLRNPTLGLQPIEAIAETISGLEGYTDIVALPRSPQFEGHKAA
jgi:FkbM family methyltransferase